MNILISGYYGFKNAGDELILSSIVTEILTRYERARVTVLSARPDETAAHYGVRSAHRWNPFNVIREIFHCDMLVSGGGGLFQDRTGSLSLYYYLFVIRLASLLKKRVFLWSVGANQLMPINRRITGRILNRADCITVRDTDTRDLFTSWGCSPEKIQLTADPVLLTLSSRCVIRQTSPVIGLILRASHRPRTPPDLMALLADSLSRHLRATILFIPFQPALDAPFCEKTRALMQCPARLAQSSSVLELCESVRKSDMIISQRLHGLILAALNDIPMAGLSYDSKIERFLREIEQKNIPSLTHEHLFTALSVIKDIWENRDDYRSRARLLLPPLLRRARLSAEYLFPQEP